MRRNTNTPSSYFSNFFSLKIRINKSLIKIEKTYLKKNL